MINLKAPEAPRTVQPWPSRSVLLEMIRACAPDLRIRKVRLPDGRRACGAQFTYAGQPYQVEAIEAEGVDPDEAIVQRCAWLLYRRLGIRMPIDDAKRARLTEAIVQASLAGDTALADKLGLELAVLNDLQTEVAHVRSRFGQ